MTVTRLACIALLLAGCASVQETRLPDPVSPAAIARVGGGLRAGFAVRDITPPPGVGLSSYAADSRQARGFRGRLRARAMVLEDAEGERLAFVVADLGQVSVLLHRRVADSTLRAGTGIGADRLILSATHTHSGPGNFFEADGLNANAGRFAGFDSVVAEFLVESIAAAVEEAASDLQPARAGWRFESVWDFTVNRSFEAFARNPSPRVPVTIGSARPPDRQAIDSTFAVLRVDRCDDAGLACEPYGAFAVFPIHGTAIPAANDLFDADVHGVVAGTVEAHLRELGGDGAFFLLAQGALGDVRPNLPDPELCRLYRFAPERAPRGPRTLPQPEAWRSPTSEVETCLEGARSAADSLSRRLGLRASEIYDSAAEGLSSEMRIRRAFRTIDLLEYSGPTPICWPPRMGAAALGGTEQGYIRSWRQRLLFFDLDFHEGGTAARESPEGCFGYKKTRLGFIVEDYTLPRVLQLGVLAVGDVILATVPVEPTTETGALIRERLLERAPEGAERALVMAVTNGYALYVTTEAEYAAQHYEGGATIYGPGSAEMLASELADLAGTVSAEEPEVDVGPVSAFLRAVPSHFWSAEPVPGGFERERRDVSCAPEAVRWRWTDLRPGTLIPAVGPVAEVQRLVGGDWITVADDASPDLRIRALDEEGAVYLWEIEWRPGALAFGSYRLRVPPRLGLSELVGESCELRLD